MAEASQIQQRNKSLCQHHLPHLIQYRIVGGVPDRRKNQLLKKSGPLFKHCYLALINRAGGLYERGEV